MAPFIVFEGIDGSGKTTQIDILRRKLVANGYNPLVTREPGGTPLGNEAGLWLRALHKLSPITELLLFNAVRAEHVTKVIQPALNEGRIVLCDRFTSSTIAYQAYGRELDVKTVERINRLATGGLQPSLTVLLDLPVKAAQSRNDVVEIWNQSQFTLWAGAREDADPMDEFEKQDREFHQRVRRGYKDMAARNAETWVTVDGTLSKETVAEKIWARLQPLLTPNGPKDPPTL